MAPAREWSTSSRVGTAAAWGGRSAGRATVWKSPAASGIRAGRAAALRLASRVKTRQIIGYYVSYPNIF